MNNEMCASYLLPHVNVLNGLSDDEILRKFASCQS